METDLSFKNFENFQPIDGDGGGGPPLTRQSSVYSLTLEEFQNTIGGIGKDFGSMNMDEFLKNIWNAEENQNIGSITGEGDGGTGAGHLQRQGSVTIPRTLSLKTVDEVWQDMLREYGGGAESSGGAVRFSASQKQPTLGEITLQDFLEKAGVVKDEAHVADRPNNGPLNKWDFGFQDRVKNGTKDLSLIGGGLAESSNQIAVQSANLPLNINFGGQVEPLQLQQQQPQQIVIPAHGVVTSNGQLGSPVARGGVVAIPKMSNIAVQSTVMPGGGGMGILGFSTAGTPAVSSDGIVKGTNEDMSISPVPYVFSGLRGRKMAAVEKVLERRQRRMIKNRESAARSRARKQAYTRELEEEVAKLKEENQELLKKQAALRTMQKNLVQEMVGQQTNGAKRPCLRRMNTGPW